MPVSKKPRKGNKASKGRLPTKRTAGWNLLREARNSINYIMGATTALATIAKDLDHLQLSAEDKAVVLAALASLKTAIVIDSETQETLLMRVEGIYSNVLRTINDQPYVKETQIANDVNQMTEWMQYTVQQILPAVGDMCDIFTASENLSVHHVALLQSVTDSINKMSA